MLRHLPLRYPNVRGRCGIAFAAAFFGLGLMLDAALRPVLTPAAAVEPEPVAARGEEPLPLDLQSDLPLKRRLDPAIVYPADVLRVIDGDTFEARVRVWPGLDVDTSIRLRGIDAAELHARCADELSRAEAARTKLQAILAEGGVSVSRVGVDKYGGRVDALASTRRTADVSAAMLSGGFARAYAGGRRGSWCG
jgi:endonuclease YncB( thermonuclease family)